MTFRCPGCDRPIQWEIQKTVFERDGKIVFVDPIHPACRLYESEETINARREG